MSTSKIMKTKPREIKTTLIAVPVIPLHLQHIPISVGPHQRIQLLSKRIHSAKTLNNPPLPNQQPTSANPNPKSHSKLSTLPKLPHPSTNNHSNERLLLNTPNLRHEPQAPPPPNQKITNTDPSFK
ncbi:hypothetical protein KC19_VG081300 [Ceratodon purpureus]|uniref:Uncharacterized protein n=1 Tax=Ceratodon purpureus TaxID=3225 RepID=A0A8T0HNQ4_CERPU|nr:hypothetical protein KC19_VG081300 [Ceratodon purpureus]